MSARTAALSAVALSLTGTLLGCTADPAPTAVPTPAASAPAASAPAASAPAAGLAAAPSTSPSAAAAPAATFRVATEEKRFRRGGRPLTTTVYRPASGAGPFPLILFSHGLTAYPTDYGDLLRRWAQAGFVVAAPAYPHTSYRVKNFDVTDVRNQPADASAVIDQMIKDDRVDAGRIAAAGHSAGGITTIGLFGRDRDPRLKAGMVMAGYDALGGAFSGPSAPILFVHGKKDTTVKYAQGLAAFTAVPWPKAMVAITDGRHVTTADDFGLVAATSTDFWRWTLYGDAAAKGRLRRDATGTRQATFTDDLS